MKWENESRKKQWYIKNPPYNKKTIRSIKKEKQIIWRVLRQQFQHLEINKTVPLFCPFYQNVLQIDSEILKYLMMQIKP